MSALPKKNPWYRISYFGIFGNFTLFMNRLLPRLGFAFLALIVILLAGVLVARTLFINYLHSDAFRAALGQGAANALGADHAEFAPLQFDGSMVYGDDFHATRADGGGFSKIDANQLRSTFDWMGLLHHTVQVDELAIQQLNIEAPTQGSVEAAAATGAEAGGTPTPIGYQSAGWKLDLRKAEIAELNWHWMDSPSGGITGAAVTMTPDGDGAWVIDAEGGTLHPGTMPDLALDSASMRWQGPTLYINSATLHNGGSHYTVTGSVASRQAADLRVALDGVDVQPFLPPDWARRLTGTISGVANVHAPLGVADAAQQVTVSGSLGMTDAQLTALPILDEIGIFTHTERFRQLELNRVSGDFTRSANRLEVRNIVVEAEGLIRMEGDYTVIDGRIDGNFQMGLSPGTLQWIPGAADQVFVDSRGGYRWTPMHVTGSVEHPVDDLTPRLIAAAANSVIHGAQDIEGTVKKAGEDALDMLLH
jgi:hypothetical protein